jgi:hypothetical protein
MTLIMHKKICYISDIKLINSLTVPSGQLLVSSHRYACINTMTHFKHKHQLMNHQTEAHTHLSYMRYEIFIVAKTHIVAFFVMALSGV